MDLPEVSEDDLDETHDVTMLPEEEITRIRTSSGTKTADAAVSLNEQPPPQCGYCMWQHSVPANLEEMECKICSDPAKIPI